MFLSGINKLCSNRKIYIISLFHVAVLPQVKNSVLN